MRLIRWGLIAVLLTILGTAIYQTCLWLGWGGSQQASQVKALEDDDQEIALIEQATNIEDWGMLVTGLKLLESDWPKINSNLPALKVSLDDAFPRLTAEVPEIVLSLSANPRQRLRLRWYKISGEHDTASWVRKLHARQRPPLAILGGGSSDRAAKLAYSLKKLHPDPEQPAPVLLLTTATSEKTTKGNSLISVYKNRTFRYSFTNQKMVAALLQFAQHRLYTEDQPWAQNLWVHKPSEPEVLTNAVASMVGSGDFWHACTVLRNFPHLQPYTMHAISWQDERYSLDMAELFEQEFKKRFPLSEFFPENSIPNCVGEFFQPAPQEQVAVNTFITNRTPVTPHSFLVLPTQSVRMRRFLINLQQRSPADARNLVIFNGDAIEFHAVYRDREVLWNTLNLPYSLVFFSHRNPIDHEAGFTWMKDERLEDDSIFPQRTTTGTHQILMFRDIFESLLYAAYDDGTLLADSLRVRQRLRSTCWHEPPSTPEQPRSPHVCNWEVHGALMKRQPFFDARGDRQSNTGEHIVWVKPKFTEYGVDPSSKISVWTIHADRNGGAWQIVESIEATYNQYRREEISP